MDLPEKVALKLIELLVDLLVDVMRAVQVAYP
jgi:hypothetical protein